MWRKFVTCATIERLGFPCKAGQVENLPYRFCSASLYTASVGFLSRRLQPAQKLRRKRRLCRSLQRNRRRLCKILHFCAAMIIMIIKKKKILSQDINFFFFFFLIRLVQTFAVEWRFLKRKHGIMKDNNKIPVSGSLQSQCSVGVPELGKMRLPAAQRTPS